MDMKPASSAYLHVSFRSDCCSLIGRWLYSITEEQLHECYATLRLAALHHNCPTWLIDARRRTDRRFNGPEWVTTAFLPQMQRELAGPLAVAFLVLPNHLHEVENDLEHSETLPVPGSLFQFARFIDEGAANAWLDQQRAKYPMRHPEL